MLKTDYETVLKLIKQTQRAADAGESLLRFRPIVQASGEAVADYDASRHDQYLTCSWLRGQPKYSAMFMQMWRSQDDSPEDEVPAANVKDPHSFGFTVEDKHVDLPAIPSSGFGVVSSVIWNQHQTAKHLANIARDCGDGECLAMETLDYSVNP